MKPVLREICNRMGLQHVAKLEKKGFGMPAEFLAQDQTALFARTKAAFEVIQRRIGSSVNIHKWAEYAGKNMNSLWATIVLGEWLEASK